MLSVGCVRMIASPISEPPTALNAPAPQWW